MCNGEVVLPDTLEKVGYNPFADCWGITVVWVEDDSFVDNLRTSHSGSLMAILPARSTMVGDVLLWDLRRQKHVEIPEGVRRIGREWFKNSEIESVALPASVMEVDE